MPPQPLGKGFLRPPTIHSTNERNCHRQIYDLCPIGRGLPRRIKLFIHKYSATHDPPRLCLFVVRHRVLLFRVKNHTRKRPTPSQKNLSQPVNGGGLNGHIESALSIWIQLINTTAAAQERSQVVVYLANWMCPENRNLTRDQAYP